MTEDKCFSIKFVSKPCEEKQKKIIEKVSFYFTHGANTAAFHAVQPGSNSQNDSSWCLNVCIRAVESFNKDTARKAMRRLLNAEGDFTIYVITCDPSQSPALMDGEPLNHHLQTDFQPWRDYRELTESGASGRYALSGLVQAVDRLEDYGFRLASEMFDPNLFCIDAHDHVKLIITVCWRLISRPENTTSVQQEATPRGTPTHSSQHLSG